jgi:NOL1/NOP2/fmu family ribosome biogenesis protein
LLSSLSVGLFDAKLVKYNYVKLDRFETKEYFRGEIIYLDEIPENKRNILSNGQIIGIYNNKIIGLFDYLKENEIKPNIVFKNEDIK